MEDALTRKKTREMVGVRLGAEVMNDLLARASAEGTSAPEHVRRIILDAYGGNQTHALRHKLSELQHQIESLCRDVRVAVQLVLIGSHGLSEDEAKEWAKSNLWSPE